ncbi:MAG: TIGR04283 family arsenosugar biosynthesis glycosyltransferase [Elusimicrobia bacterium]|nr:TIGR04283 family arsenosugar biosynthesis glycosyltransferase [Elusimicrobiota bacterium]
MRRMKVSVVIPTVNERRRLAETVARLRLTAGRGDIEVIVADGASTDGTAEIARRVADKLVDSPVRGRAVQMHQGALAATGDILLFLHADTRLPGGWLGALLDAWASKPRPGATAYRLDFESAKPVYRLIATLGHWRSRKTGVPHGDQAVACRREDYARVGGFPPVSIMEEYYLLPKLARLGPVVVMEEAVLTSVRRYERNGPVFNALRNVAIIALFKAGVSPERLRRLYL